MREAFAENSRDETTKIKPLKNVDEISIFLAGNSSKAQIVKDIFNDYILIDELIEQQAAKIEQKNNAITDSESKVQKIFGLNADEMPKFKIYPALGIPEAHEIQKARGVEINPNDLAAPTGKTGVAFGLLKCRDSGNLQITHMTPNTNFTPFQFYIGRNKKRKFKTIIDKNTRLGVWHSFIDASNNFDILYTDLPEAVSNTMDVQKARRIHITLENYDEKLIVFIRAVKSNVLEYQVAEDIEDFENPEKLKGVEPCRIVLE